MADLKIPAALVFAMIVQVVAAVWWASEKHYQIEYLHNQLQTLQEQVYGQDLDIEDLVTFAEFTENKWAQGYDEDPSYQRIFGQKPLTIE